MVVREAARVVVVLQAARVRAASDAAFMVLWCVVLCRKD